MWQVTHRHHARGIQIPAFIRIQSAPLNKPNRQRQVPQESHKRDPIPRFLSDLKHEACYLQIMGKTEIGVMAHNEAGNLHRLLDRLLSEPGDHRICIVSSGSTDKTNQIAENFVRESPQVRLIIEAARNGKARAINRFFADLSPDCDRVVIVSADVLPQPGALARLLEPLDDPNIQMTGARPCPSNPKKGIVNRAVHFQWELLDRIAQTHPKLGEMIAFRPPIDPIDPNTVVDEAALEAQLIANSGRLAYVREATVTNMGPQNLLDLIAQRERIWMGHLRLHQRTGYRVSTYRLRWVCRSAMGHLCRRPSDVPAALVAASVELFARVRGSYRYRVRGELPTIWQPLLSAKVR